MVYGTSLIWYGRIALVRYTDAGKDAFHINYGRHTSTTYLHTVHHLSGINVYIRPVIVGASPEAELSTRPARKISNKYSIVQYRQRNLRYWRFFRLASFLYKLKYSWDVLNVM